MQFGNIFYGPLPYDILSHFLSPEETKPSFKTTDLAL